MAFIGKIYIGGKNYGQSLDSFNSSVCFILNKPSSTDYVYLTEDREWEVELAKGQYYAVARAKKVLTSNDVINIGLEKAQMGLDDLCVKQHLTYTLSKPVSHNIALYKEQNLFYVRHYTLDDFGIGMSFSFEKRDANGNIIEQPKEPTKWTWAFRYYRLSQASTDIFDAYRNLYLSFEALLNEICKRRRGEKELKWLKRALEHIIPSVSLKSFRNKLYNNPIDYIIKVQYDKIRCNLFHAKPPYSFFPHNTLTPTDILSAYEELLGIWRDIGTHYFGVPSGGGLITYQGFKHMMDNSLKNGIELCFSEDNSVISGEDTKINPNNLREMPFDISNYLSETQPGVVSFTGIIDSIKVPKDFKIYRIASCFFNQNNEKNLHNLCCVPDGLDISDTDKFETYQSLKLLNTSSPKTTF